MTANQVADGRPEGRAVPEGLPPVVDAHVHLFPDRLYSAIWRWFDTFAWPIRYRMSATEVVDFLLARGVSRVVGLLYAHKPGIARDMNAFMADLCRLRPQVTGLGTVFPGEEGAAEILEEAFGRGLVGVKLHAHVQCCDMGGPAVDEVFAVCDAHSKRVVVHGSREPRSDHYRVDPYGLCSAEKLERLLRRYPRLRVCVPHLGYGEFDAYQTMLRQYDNLWVDTTMMLGGFFPAEHQPPLQRFRADRVMYGTDFPQIPYEWDRELSALCSTGLSDGALERILGKNAAEFFGIPG